MGIGISVLLLAAGAILRWAVTADAEGFDLNAVGIILMVVGAIGLIWSLIVSSAMPWRRDEVIEDRRARRV